MLAEKYPFFIKIFSSVMQQVLTHEWLSVFISENIQMDPKYFHWEVKVQYVHFRLHTNYFFVPWMIAEKINRQSVLLYN